MNLFEKLALESDSVDATCMGIKNEIVSNYREYVMSERFENYIQSKANVEALTNRRLVLYASYWEYVAGCSGTHFSCSGWKWKNPDADEYSYEACIYKGIKLRTIQAEVIDTICKLTCNALYTKGFVNVNIVRNYNRFGEAEFKIVVEW